MNLGGAATEVLWPLVSGRLWVGDLQVRLQEPSLSGISQCRGQLMPGGTRDVLLYHTHRQPLVCPLQCTA